MDFVANPYVLIVAGVALLLSGAEILVRGGTTLASRFGISKLVVGLTIVAFGTSAPEFAINAIAALGGETELGLGNIVGSNIANLLLILGVVALLAPPRIRSGTVWREIPLSLFAVFVLFVTANAFSGGSLVPDLVTRSDGLVLLGFFGLFMAFMFARMRADRSALSQDEPRKRVSVWLGVLYIGLGAVGLLYGGRWIVNGATVIAAALGLSPYTIGATIVAIGTSLPELATSVVAARKGESDVAVGNVIGSNIFNIFWVLGATAVIAPIASSVSANIDMVILAGATVLLFVFMFLGARLKLQRSQGFIFILLYGGYITTLLLRN